MLLPIALLTAVKWR